MGVRSIAHDISFAIGPVCFQNKITRMEQKAYSVFAGKKEEIMLNVLNFCCSMYDWKLENIVCMRITGLSVVI